MNWKKQYRERQTEGLCGANGCPRKSRKGYTVCKYHAFVSWVRGEANRRLLGGTGSANKSTSTVAAILGKSEDWVQHKKQRLIAEIWKETPSFSTSRAKRRKQRRTQQQVIRLANAFDFSESGKKNKKHTKVKTRTGTTLVRYRTTTTFRNDVGFAANGVTFFTRMTDTILRYWANHILAYGDPKTSTKEAHDPANGFLDFQWIGDMVEDGLLGIKNGRIICDHRVSNKVHDMVGEGRKVSLTEAQKRYWQKHQETIFGRAI